MIKPGKDYPKEFSKRTPKQKEISLWVEEIYAMDNSFW